MTLEKIIDVFTGDIVSFSYNEYSITGIISRVQKMNDEYEVITGIEIVPFSEWGKVPERQGASMYFLDQVYNFQILGSTKKIQNDS
jgi:hypothetical protein